MAREKHPITYIQHFRKLYQSSLRRALTRYDKRDIFLGELGKCFNKPFQTFLAFQARRRKEYLMFFGDWKLFAKKSSLRVNCDLLIRGNGIHYVNHHILLWNSPFQGIAP